jgi:hypothetical protein
MTTAILGTWVLSATLAGNPSATVAEGMKQYQDGLLTEAVATLQRAIDTWPREATADRRMLVNAHIYQGAALVGLLHEEPAKATFRRALALDPERRLQKGEFPDRVVRVFEAARKRKEDSVMERPPSAAQKAGSGAKTLWQVFGGTLLVTGAILAVEKSIEEPEPSPSPSPRAAAGMGRGPVAWSGGLTVPGGAAQVALNGGSAGTLQGGVLGLGGSPQPDVNHVEAVLTAGRGPGTWSFTFAEGAIQPGSLAPLAGEAAQVGPLGIVFRSTGTPGERVAFRFRARE